MGNVSGENLGTPISRLADLEPGVRRSAKDLKVTWAFQPEIFLSDAWKLGERAINCATTNGRLTIDN